MTFQLVDFTYPSSVVAKLKCSICDNYLSYGHIYLRRDENICGRCAPRNEITRNILYETAVAHLLFPCRYRKNGCDEQEFLRMMPQHEDSCNFRPVACPCCDWKDSMNAFSKHCMKDHTESILARDIEFEIDLNSSYEVTKFYAVNKSIVMVMWEFNLKQQKLTFLVTEHYEERCPIKYHYILHLRFGLESSTTLFPSDEIVDIAYKDMFGNMVDPPKSIFALFELQHNDYKDFFLKKDLNLGVLNNLKCSSCSVFALCPVFERLDTGALKCNECIDPSSPDYVKSDDLNNLAEFLLYPCENFGLGCTEKYIPLLMKQHKRVCTYQNFTCRIDKGSKQCKYTCPKREFNKHLINFHAPTEENYFKWEVNSNRFAVLTRFKNSYFHLSYFSTPKELNFFITKILNVTESFMFRLILKCHRKPSQRMIWEGPCQESNNCAITIPLSIARDYLECKTKKNYIHFEVYIFKKPYSSL